MSPEDFKVFTLSYYKTYVIDQHTMYKTRYFLFPFKVYTQAISQTSEVLRYYSKDIFLSLYNISARIK